MKIEIKEFRDVLNPKKVGPTTVPYEVYYIDETILDDEPTRDELHRIKRAMIYNATKFGWDWVQMYRSDTRTLYHGTVTEQ